MSDDNQRTVASLYARGITPEGIVKLTNLKLTYVKSLLSKIIAAERKSLK